MKNFEGFGLSPVLTQSLAPVPWPTDRAAVLEALRGLQVQGSAHTVWLSDGLSDGAVQPMAARLQQMGGVEVLEPIG